MDEFADDGTAAERSRQSWDASRIRLPREERAEVVSSLRESGLSLRAIAAATGLNHQTVANDLSKNRQLPPAPVDYEPTGMDEFAVRRATPPHGGTGGGVALLNSLFRWPAQGVDGRPLALIGDADVDRRG